MRFFNFYLIQKRGCRQQSTLTLWTSMMTSAIMVDNIDIRVTTFILLATDSVNWTLYWHVDCQVQYLLFLCRLKWRHIGIILCRLSVRTSVSLSAWLSICPTFTILVRTTSEELVVQFHLKFTEMIRTKSCYVYRQHFLVQRFLSESLPFSNFLF
jgi:hypothetical protein